jgi:hypothetical protein
MDVLVAKGLFLLVTIGAFVVFAKIFRDLLKNRFTAENRDRANSDEKKT